MASISFNKGRKTFVISAILSGVDNPCAELIESVAGQPVERRLNRIERVALSFNGQLHRRLDGGLLMSFDTADNAILGACAMQKRCAAVPQIAGNRYVLRIGIHKVAPDTPQPPGAGTGRPERRNRSRRAGFDAASRLAFAAPDGGIAVSGLVLATASPTIRRIAHALHAATLDLPVHILDWNSGVTEQVPPVLPDFLARQPTRKLILTHGAECQELDRLNSVISFGRDPGCDIVLNDAFASRVHAHIRITAEGCVLTDLSQNGTCLTLRNGERLWARNESLILEGRGVLCFGQALNQSAASTFSYEVLSH